MSNLDTPLSKLNFTLGHNGHTYVQFGQPCVQSGQACVQPKVTIVKNFNNQTIFKGYDPWEQYLE